MTCFCELVCRTRPNDTGYVKRPDLVCQDVYFEKSAPLCGVENESYAGVTHYIGGELVPELVVELDGGQRIFFEHHIVLWKTSRQKHLVAGRITWSCLLG